jgi:hypothetical protein
VTTELTRIKEEANRRGNVSWCQTYAEMQGWDLGAIEATAEQGAAELDVEILGAEAADELVEWCQTETAPSTTDQLEEALYLALTAPDDTKAAKASTLGEQLASSCTTEEIAAAKEKALARFQETPINQATPAPETESDREP